MEDKEDISVQPEDKSRFEVVTSVHQQLMDRFGNYKESGWEPKAENIRVLDDKSFDEEVGSLLREAENSSLVAKYVRSLVGYAHLTSGKLYVRISEGETQTFRQIIGHEMLHLWFNRTMLDEGNYVSYGVNETFVDILALEALGLYTLPPSEREANIDNAVHNSLIIKKVIDKLGEEGWNSLFRVCQTGDQREITSLTQKNFGAQPPTRELVEINKGLPILFGQDFWGRLKEVALMIDLIRSDPTFQERNPLAVYRQMHLIMGWAGVDIKSLEAEPRF